MGKSEALFFVKISAPAQRALKGAGINSVAELSKFTRREILHLHGMGPSAIPKLEEALKQHGLTFKQSDQ